MARTGYNLTDDVAMVVHLLALRVPRLAHLRPAQILHGVSQARNRSRYGTYAQCHGLRFKHGKREHIARGHAWVWPEVRVRGHEILYYITYFMPRFMDQTPRDRLNTLVHELWHISPRFDGDLRRFPGRNEFHGGGFERTVDELSEEALASLDVDRYPFLRWSFDEIVTRYGSIIGNRLKGFKPRRVPATELATNLAVRPAAAAREPGRQRSLFAF